LRPPSEKSDRAHKFFALRRRYVQRAAFSRVPEVLQLVYRIRRAPETVLCASADLSPRIAPHMICS
jgi:hypothetical protein